MSAPLRIERSAHVCDFCVDAVGSFVVGGGDVRICRGCIAAAAELVGQSGMYRVPTEALATYITEGLELLREIRDAQARPPVTINFLPLRT